MKLYTIYGNATWKVLNIDYEKSSAVNDSSIVVELSYGGTKYLFMGDATTTVENSRKWESVDVLKVGHHGSNTSTSTEFIEQIKPTYAIISVGKNNYGHPAESVLNNLKDTTIYRTDEDGTIWLTSDGNKITINKLNYNLDGMGKKHANIFLRKYYVLSFLVFIT